MAGDFLPWINAFKVQRDQKSPGRVLNTMLLPVSPLSFPNSPQCVAGVSEECNSLIDVHAQPNGVTLPRQRAEVRRGCHHAGVGNRDVEGGLKCIENEEMPSNPLKLNIWPTKSFVVLDSGLSALIPFSCSRVTPVGSGCLWNTVGK